MTRPIDADALKRKLQMNGTDAWKKQITASVETILNEVIDIVDALPTVAPVRHGKWMGTVCTACGESEPYYYDFKYCPHCGAKMDG